MKAILCTQYGSADLLQLKEVAKPVPADNEVLVKVHAASLTPSDCSFRKADPFMIRFIYGLTRPKFPILGVELSGEIEATGKAVKRFKKGDRVFGMNAATFGAHAEYVCLPEDSPLAVKPANLSYAEASGICDGAPTALTFLKEIAKIRDGQKVLINGASGAVGAYAVQLARHLGAQVTGVCGATNLEMVKALGASNVIDYTKEDFTKNGLRYDVIFDAIGKSSFSHCKGSLTPTGIYLSTVPSLTLMLQMLWTSKVGSQKAIFAAAGTMQSKENLTFLAGLVEAGQIKPVIDRCYPLEQIAEAHRYVEKGHKKGNVIITVYQADKI